MAKPTSSPAEQLKKDFGPATAPDKDPLASGLDDLIEVLAHATGAARANLPAVITDAHARARFLRDLLG